MTSSHDPYAPFVSKDPMYVDASDSPAQKPPPHQEPEPVIEVPKGTTKEVLEWVGTDRVRAQAALDSEEDSGKPRKTLVEELKEKLGQ